MPGLEPGTFALSAQRATYRKLATVNGNRWSERGACQLRHIRHAARCEFFIISNFLLGSLKFFLGAGRNKVYTQSQISVSNSGQVDESDMCSPRSLTSTHAR